MSFQFDTLAQQVANILARFDPTTAKRWLDMYPDQPLLPIEQQMAAINNFWRLQLGLCNDTVTIEIREHLLDRCSVEDWLRLFEERVAMHIVHLGLPVPHDVLTLISSDPAGVFKLPL